MNHPSASMQLKKVSIILALCAGYSALTAAESESTTRSMSLQDCFQAALERNLDLQIQRLYPEMYRAQVGLAYGGYDPSLTLQGAHNFNLYPAGIDVRTQLEYLRSSTDRNQFSASLSGSLPSGLTYTMGAEVYNSYGYRTSTSFNESGGSAYVNLTQPLLKNFWIDSTRMTISANKKLLKKSLMQLRYQVMSIVLSVEQAYYDVVAASGNLEVQQKALELAERFLAENKKRVEVGTMAPLEEKQAESQVASSRAQLLSAQQLLAERINNLKKLTHDNFSDWASQEIQPKETLLASPQAFSLQDSWHRGLTSRPDFLQQKIEVERLDIVLKFRKNQLWPELNLTGTYGHTAGGGFGGYVSSLNQLSDGENPYYSYGAIFRMPLSNKQSRENYRITKTERQQAILLLKKQEQEIMVAIDNAIKLAKASYERVDATKKACQYAQEALEAEQKKLEAGKTTSYVVLQMQRDLTYARSQELQALADYNKALATLSFNEGSILDRHGIAFESE